METEGKGGLEAYKSLIDRADLDLTFTEYLEGAGLCSPFDEDILRNIANELHYYILGYHYYRDSDDEGCNAA